jgi:hypothetical protein
MTFKYFYFLVMMTCHIFYYNGTIFVIPANEKLAWQPSWNSEWNKDHTKCRGILKKHFFQILFQLVCSMFSSYRTADFLADVKFHDFQIFLFFGDDDILLWHNLLAYLDQRSIWGFAITLHSSRSLLVLMLPVCDLSHWQHQHQQWPRWM